MPHQALYRKWRPQRFSDVVGQPYTVQTLKNAIARGEVAHAYLFAGPRGTGKTSVARIFAKAMNCLQVRDGEPCNECPPCQAIGQGNHLDVLEIDGASNRGIDQIRQLREEVNFAPAQGRYKVYIIDEVHMLTHEAFNALLKTLEEPPSHAVFILATTEPHKVPPTVLSRCQAFEFKAIPAERIAAHLQRIAQAEGILLSPAARDALARHARGALRDALVLLDQLASLAGEETITADALYEMLGLPSEEILERFLNALLRHDRATALQLIANLAERGRDLELFVEELLRRCRDRLLASPGQGAQSVPPEARLVKDLLELRRELRFALDPRLLLEVFVLARSPIAVENATEPKPPSAPPSPVPAASASDSAVSREAGRRVADRASKAAPREEEGQSERPPLDISQAWRELLARARREKAALQALLAEASPRVVGSTLYIEYPPDYTFHKERLEQPTQRSFLQALVREIFGEVQVVIGFSSGSGSASAASPAGREAQEASPIRSGADLQEGVRRVREAFAGHLLHGTEGAEAEGEEGERETR